MVVVVVMPRGGERRVVIVVVVVVMPRGGKRRVVVVVVVMMPRGGCAPSTI